MSSPDEPPAGAPAPADPPQAPKPNPFLIAGLVAITFFLGGGFVLYQALRPPPASTLTVRPTPNLLVAIHDVGRLETTELRLEKVIDLTDRQSHLYGLVEATDAILLVASGVVIVGVDLSRVGDGDVTFDKETRVAKIKLPSPAMLSSRLDEKNTYVYTRSTSILARRNEQLETRARREALEAIERAAQEADVSARAKEQAERQLRSILMPLDVSRVDFEWR